uniref:Protein SON n=1 Tax=Chrysolophus pictus TaxID=9089 RepID=A0A8C3KZN7_CHRPC
MATNIEQIFRSFVVNKFREIQEEQQQQQQHGGGKVEGQPNGDTIPAEQANPSDDTVAGAGSRQNDQIVQKIEEVLSGALDTELQSKSDVDKTTVSNSTQSTKRSSTAEGEDEIPKKKSKKNKKHKSKKKKKKKKKRKKEKKHKKQPKESKLSARHGELVDSQPASHLIPEKSSSTLSVQHGGFGDANLGVHIQPEGLSLQANVELDRQALGLASQLRTDSQPCMENLESEKGTLCATEPQFNLEGSQFIIQQNASMAQTEICTREEQIKQSHESIYPVAINVSEKGDFFATGSVASTSVPSGVANKSELQKLALPSEVKTMDTSLASNTMEVSTYSEASLKSVALGGTKELETTSESMCLTSDVATISKPADLNTVKVTDMSMAIGEVRIPGATELPVVSGNLRVAQCRSMEGSSILKAASESVVMMGDVKNKELDPDAALQHSFKVPAETAVSHVQIESAKTPLAPGTVEVKDIEPVRVSLHVGSVRPMEEVLQPMIKSKTSEAVMVVRGTSDSATALNASEALLQCAFSKEMQSLTDVNVVAEAKGLQTTSEPVVQTLVPQTVPVALQLENSNVLRGLEATPQSSQKEDMKKATSLSLQMESMKASGEPSTGSMEAVMVPETLAEMMHLKKTAERETAHAEAVAVPFSASKTESCIVSQPEIVTSMRGLEATSQTVFVGEKKDFEVARSSTVAEVRGLDNLAEVKAVAEARGAETGSETSCLTKMKNLEMALGSETRTQMQDWGTTLISEVEDLNKAKIRSKETVLEPVQTVTVKISDTSSRPVCLEELGTTIEYGTGSKPDKIEAESMAVKVVEHSKTTSGPLQEQVAGNSEAALESFRRVEETVMEVRNLKETLQSEILTDVVTRESGIVTTRKADREKTEFSPVVDVKGLEEASGIEKEMKAKHLEPASEAGEVRLESMEESAAAEVKGSETVKEAEVYMDIQGLETSQKYGEVAEINVLEDASEAFIKTKQHIESVPQYLRTGTQEHAQTVLEAKPTAEWRSTEEAAEIWGAAEMKYEAVPKPEDTQDLGTMLEHEVAAKVQYSEGQQCQQMEDVSISSLALEHEIVAEKNDSEQALPLEPFIALSDGEIATKSGVPAETIFSSSHAANVIDSTGTPESEIIRDAKHLEGLPSSVAETEGLETTHISEPVVEVKDAEAVEEAEADTKDLEAAPVPETVTEVAPVLVEEASQLEAIPQAEADKEVAAEEASETRDSETSDVQPDVAARMRETLMRLEKVIEKSSHRSSEKSKHDAKKQKRSRSKSQSRSRKRKKKSRSRSTSRRLTSKRARSRSRNYSDSRKKHSKSRSRSVEKRERRVSSRRSRRRRSRSSDRYRSKSRSVEKTRRSGRGRSRSSDRYRSKSRSVEKRESRLSSRRSRRRRSRSSDRYRSKSRSAEKRGSRLSSRRSRRGRSRSSDRYRSKSRSVEKTRRSGRRRSRSSDRYRSKSRSVEKTRRSGRRRSRSSDRYRSKSRSVEKTRRSGRRRSRSSDRYRSKSRSVEKTRRSGRRRSRSSDRYRSKSPSVEKRGSRLSSWRSRRRRSRSSDHSKSRSRSSEKRGGKEYSWRFRHRGSGSSDRSKSRSRSVEKRGRKASVRRSKRRRSKSSDRYKSRSRSVEKRDRKQSSRKSKRQRSKSSDRYKSRSKSVEKKKESSRKSKRRRSKSSERYKSRSRSVEKKRKDSSKKSKRKRSKSSDSLKSRSKSVEKRASKLASAKCSRKHADSSEQEKVDGSEPVTSEISSSKSSNGPMSVALSLEGVNGPELPPPSGSGFCTTVESLETSLSVEKMDGPQPSVIPELDTSKTSNDQEQHSMPVEKTQVSVTSENGSATPYDSDLGSVPAEKAAPLESSSLTELTFSASSSVSSSVEKRDAETTSATEFHLSTSHQDESRSTSLKETEGAEPLLTNESGCSVSADDYKSTSTSSGKMEIQGFSLMSGSVLSDGCELRHIPAENAEPQKFLQVPQSGFSELADSTESRSLSYETAEVQKPFLAPEVTSSEFLNVHESVSLPIAQGRMEVPSLTSDSVRFRTPDRHELASSFGTQTGEVPLISEGTPLQSPIGKVKAPSASLSSECGPVEITVDHISTSSSAKIQEVFLTTVEQSCKSSEAHESSSSVEKDLDGSASSQVLGVGCFENSEMHESRHLPAEKIEVTESALSTSGIPLYHRGHVSKYSYFEKTKGVDTVELISTSAEKFEATAPCLTSEGGLFILPDSHELRATPTENVEVQKSSLSSEQKCITSPDEHQLRSPSGREIQVREEQPLIVERRRSVSSDEHDSRSTAGEEVEDLEPLAAEHRRSVSPDGRESRSTTGEEAEDREPSLTVERRQSTSSDERESRSTTGEDVEDVEPSLTAERRDSTSSDDQDSRSTTGEEAEDMELSLTTEHRRSTSPDGRESRSTTGEEGEDVEPSLTAERRDSTSSDDHESRSTTGEEVEDMEPSLAVEDKHEGSPSIPLEKSEGQDSSFMTESRRSESSDREKSRSESAEKMSDRESSQRSRSRPSKSPTHQMSRSPSADKVADEESSRRSRHRRSRSTSVEKAADKESSRRSRHRRSRSTSVDKTADKESSRRSRRRRSRSTARQRSRSKSVDKTADKESSRRSRSRRSRSSQRRSQRYDADSRSRRNRSRSVTRRRASRSKSTRRSRSSSLSRSRHRRRSRSRSASRRRRSLSRDRRRRSQRNRSRSADRRRRRSDSRDRRISLRLRSRSRTPLRQRRSRSRGRRRSSSRSPIRLRRSRSSGRRRGYSRSPDRRRSRSSERFSSRSPKRLTDLDKAQLLEIAKANAAAMCAKSGVPLPPSLMPMLSQKKDDKASQKSSRDTLKELTEKCKKIAQSTDDVIVNKPHVSDEEEEERPFYNHPFKLNEPKPIFFNLSTPSIKPAPPPQPKNQVSLSKEFPVSSGSQHRKKEADSVYGEWVPVEKGKEDSKDDVFPKPSIEGVDITAAMNDRAMAQKRLNENTFDLEAMCMLNRAQEQIDAWAQSNSIPGQFTGSTGAQILSSDELTNSGPQAWIRKDQFLRAAPVTGGMGAQLMRKMGWREGEGLGKNKEGSVEPIMVDFKTDRKGLVAVGEKAQKRSGHYVVMKDLSGKHPVSALMEICNKRRWSPPEFVLVDDSGPDHRKHFIFKRWLGYAGQCLSAKVSEPCFCESHIRSLQRINLQIHQGTVIPFHGLLK